MCGSITGSDGNGGDGAHGFHGDWLRRRLPVPLLAFLAATSGATEDWVVGGFASFAQGQPGDGGANIYVNAKGEVEMIHRWDVNGDGYPDIILANSHDYKERGPTRIHSASVTRAGHGTFQELPTDSGWMGRVVDLDRDGHADLVVANGENGVTSELNSYVYWGGTGGVGASRAELATLGAYDVAIIDLNRDGMLDLVFPSAWRDHHNPGRPLLARVYLATGQRSFVDASERFGITCTGATSIASDDLNADGYSDLVVASYRKEFELDSKSLVYWGTEQGIDTSRPMEIATHGAQNVLISDLNDDGKKDIVFSGANRVQICWNRDGKFERVEEERLDVAGVSSMFSLGAVRCAVADVDGDGRTDLILASKSGLEIRSGQDVARVKQLLPVKDLHWVTAADLDGDGRMDLVASRYSDGKKYDTRSPIFWNGPGGFGMERVSWVDTMGAVGNTAGDLNGDGRQEVVFCNTMSGHLKGIFNYVYLGSQSGEYRTGHRIDLPTDGSGQALVADLDLDGYVECVFTEPAAIRIFPGSASGPTPGHFVDIPSEPDIQDIQVADFDRDGHLDILATAIAPDARPQSLERAARIYFGQRGAYSIERSKVLPVYGNAANLADINKDGYLDILFNDRRNFVLVYLGGREGYDEQRTLRIPTPFPLAVNTADLDADGWLDIVVSNGGHYQRLEDTLHIFFGGPHGYSAHRSQSLYSLYSAGFTGVADFNRDGVLDLLVTAYSTPNARVIPAQLFFGDGKGLDLKRPLDLPAESSTAVTHLDLNRDGWIDLILACHRNDIGHAVDSLIYWNSAQGFARDRVTRLPGLGPHGMTSRDRGNNYTRLPEESYTSGAHALSGRIPRVLRWRADVPEDARVTFQLRWAPTEAELESAVWQGPGGKDTRYVQSGSEISAPPEGAAWMQFRTIFYVPYGGASPRLKEVRVEFN
jgi:hypothetical protein